MEQQCVRRRGMVIVTTKPASMRLAYGNERVRQLREQRIRLDDVAERPRGFLSRLVSSIKTEPLPDPAPAVAHDPAPVATTPVVGPKRRDHVVCPLLRKIGSSWKTFLQQRHTLGQDHSVTAITMHKLGCLCRDAERFDEAAKWFHFAHSVWTRQLGSDHPSVAHNLREWAELMARQGFDAEALRLRTLAETILRRARVA